MMSELPNESMVSQVWDWLGTIPDPEIPVVSILDLGMIRDVLVEDAGVNILLSPTYSGCPAIEVIEDSIVTCVQEMGVANVTVTKVLSPPWTTDWITAAGREKLLRYGIVPPETHTGKRALLGKPAMCCPQCGSADTKLVSEFGSTACKAACKCNACLEPFEFFKCI